MSPRAFGVLFLLAAIWGGSYLFIKIGVADIPPLIFVALRLVLAAAFSHLLLRLRGRKMGRAWPAYFVMGVFNGALPYTLITWGELYIPSGLAAILTAAVPIFTVLLAHLAVSDEQLTPSRLAGVLIGFVGVGILIGPDALQGLRASVLGQLAVVGAALSYALAIIYGRRALRGESAFASTVGQLTAGAVIMVPVALLLGNPAGTELTWPAVLSLLTLALLGTSVAYLLYYWLLRHVGATQTALVTYLMPFMGVLWGALVLNERLGWNALLALLLILLGVLTVHRAAPVGVGPS